MLPLCSDSIWHSIWNSVNMGLVLLNGEGRIMLWNNWMVRHSGIDEKSTIGLTLEAVFPQALNSAFKTALNNALRHKLPVILSNALHRSPLPLYPLPVIPNSQARIHQSLLITPVIGDQGEYCCLIQVTDTSMTFKRERALKLHSNRHSMDATTDSLTGAYNRRFFDDSLKIEFSRAQRKGKPLSLLMLDIDHFKNYNDCYGSLSGDRALASTVQVIKSQLNQSTDVVARYGDEEFAVILIDCSTENAVLIAEKIRTALAEKNIPHEKSDAAAYLTVSIGIGTYLPGSELDLINLLEIADTALYLAKNEGRDCVKSMSLSDYL